MAEALGVAANGIAVAQIAIQVGGTAVKLKQLWDEVKDVPDDITDLMDQLDCLDPVLWEVENGFNKVELPSILWDDLASKSTSRYCRKALENLTAMVEELNLEISSAKKGWRKIKAVKVLLQKDSIKKLERRLEKAVRMLTLAQQSYLVALTQVQPDIIIQKFTTLTFRRNQYEPQQAPDYASKAEVQTVSRLHHEQQDTGDVSTKPRWIYRTRRTRPNYFGRVCIESFATGSRILFQAPAWFSYRSWELHSIRANGAWQWNLRSYRCIPWDSEIFSLVQSGSPQDIQRLFDVGLASPYDYSSNGWTLLHSALLGQNVEAVEYLIRINLSNNTENLTADSNMYAFIILSDIILSNMSPGTSSFIKEVTSDASLIRPIFGEPEVPEYDDSVHDPSSTCTCSPFLDPEVYLAVLPYLCPSHRSTSLRSRLKQAKISLRSLASIEVAKLILEPEWSTNPQAIRSCPDFHSIITEVAFKLGLITVTSLPGCPAFPMPIEINYSDAGFRGCFAFAVDIIKETPDIHAFSSCEEYPLETRGTAMVNMLQGIRCAYCVIRTSTQSYPISKLARGWLEALKQAGVDLEAYGRREHEIFVEKNYSTAIDYYDESHLVDFQFGPNPEDWEFYFCRPIDDYVGEFWKLVEDPPIRVPGSWVDGDDHHHRRNCYYDGYEFGRSYLLENKVVEAN
ncbi:hypothetical protein F5Y00DRAFT_267139 [Daldinia vernicosa]|uniref:uncharacterized protein n=1 Tax=Daldinia vernicosa TaxID=114800 RepID=UPI002007773C|nr:uncharacterized protein F5Y00DRAFT_267139 [Daldinia vernicosa]KAI0843876.1 hypothetical protein F5Y00DRAFT_267139 [Daldinia vernicosa]